MFAIPHERYHGEHAPILVGGIDDDTHQTLPGYLARLVARLREHVGPDQEYAACTVYTVDLPAGEVRAALLPDRTIPVHDH